MICAESVLHFGYVCAKSAVLNGSVSDPAELSGILDLPLNKDAPYKNAFAMKHWLSVSKDLNGRRILS